MDFGDPLEALHALWTKHQGQLQSVFVGNTAEE